MNKLFLSILILFFASQSKTQDDNNLKCAFYFDTISTARSAKDLPTAYQYLDSMAALGEAFAWEAKITLADIYRFIEDSLPIGNQIIDECIEHYKKYPDNALLLEAYHVKVHIAEYRRDISMSITNLNEAVLAAQSINDSFYMAFFEKCLGFFYLDNLADTSNSILHLTKAFNLATQSNDWFQAALASGELIDYYLFVQNIPQARKYADSCVFYSSQMDSSETNRYYGWIDRGDFFSAIGDYPNAIKDGLFVFQKGIEEQDYDIELWGAYLLTKAYWKTGMLDKAFYFARIALDLLDNEGGAYELKKQYYWSSKIYAAKGMHEEALELLEQFYAFEKKDYEKLEVKTIAKTLYQGELERKELEKSKVELSLLLAEKQSSFKSIIIGGVLILFIIVIIYSFLLYKKRQKTIQMNQILAASNEVVLKQKELLVQNIKTLKKDLQQQPLKDQGTFYFSQSAVQIKFSDIVYLESSNNYVLIYVIDRKTPLLERIKMIELIKHFPSNDFIKTHRSYYVNKHHIIARPSKYKFKMSNDSMLNASRSYVDNLENIGI